MIVVEMCVLFSLALSTPPESQEESVPEERGADADADEAEDPPEVDPWTFSEDSLDEIDVPADAAPAPDDNGPAEAAPSPDDSSASDEPLPADDRPALGDSALTGGTAEAVSWVDDFSEDDDDDPFASLADARVGSWESAPEIEAKQAALSATATSSEDESAIYQRGGTFGSGLILGAKAGAGRAQAASGGLGWSLVGELELGYTPPLPEPVGRDLQLSLSAGYAAPSMESAVAGDGRLGAESSWRYRLTLHQAIATLGVLYRLPTPLPWFRPYAAAGARGYWSWTVVDGEIGSQPFLQTTEARFDLGGYGGAGADLMLGPGAFLAELQIGLAFLDGRVLKTSQGTVNLVLGYRLML